MTWRPVYVTTPLATAYGIAIDFIWATNGQPGALEQNCARRREWPAGYYIHVLPCVPNAIDDPNGYDPDQRWVFCEDESEYCPTDADLTATDWVVG